MTVYALTSPQPAATLEAIRDQTSGFLPYCLPPTIVREVQSLPSLRWVPDDGIPDGRARRTSTVSPVLPDQPCPECGGGGSIVRGPAESACRRCAGEGRVPLPLLITGEQWRSKRWGGGYSPDDWRSDAGPSVANPYVERRVAGLAVLDRPGPPLPVVARLNVLRQESYVWVGKASVQLIDRATDSAIDITDAFPTPPPVGSWVLDVSGARWLPEPVTEQKWRRVPGDYMPDRVPLSPDSGGLTVVEVPNHGA